MEGVAGVVALDSQGFHTLAVATDGAVWAWGYYADGQLGDGRSGSTHEHFTRTPVRVAGPSGARGVAAGTAHSLAIDGDGTLWAWGGNTSGQLGLASADTCGGRYACGTTAVRVPGLAGIRQVAAGIGHSLALAGDGRVWAWGANDYGQLGESPSTCGDRACVRTAPARVPGLDAVVAIHARADTSYAVKADGTLWAWGANASWQAGPPAAACGGTPCTPAPTRVPGLPSVRAVAGSGHVAVLAQGTPPSPIPASWRTLVPWLNR